MDSVEPVEETMENALWYAAGGYIARCGPFKTQQEAWKAMRLVDRLAAQEHCPYPKNTRVWPEWGPATL